MHDPRWRTLFSSCATEVNMESWRVKRILLTTFDTADAGLLVEHLLPCWHGLPTQFDGDDESKNPFLVALSETLKSVESMTIISSSHLCNGPQSYPWLWRFIRPAMVGMHQEAVQHAKLWMFHREATGVPRQETLEICVSSANLTLSAFHDQVQAAWRCVVPLERETKQRLRSWGVMPDFLDELARACGKPVEDAMQQFVVLLRRAQCPEGVHFVASVPGTHRRRELMRLPWGMAGLRRAMPPTTGRPKVFVTTPAVGSWAKRDLEAWLKAAGCAPADLTLGWVSKDVADSCPKWGESWTLPSATAILLRQLGASISAIRNHHDNTLPRLHADHQRNDDRWLHAKLYGFSCGS